MSLLDSFADLSEEFIQLFAEDAIGEPITEFDAGLLSSCNPSELPDVSVLHQPAGLQTVASASLSVASVPEAAIPPSLPAVQSGRGRPKGSTAAEMVRRQIVQTSAQDPQPQEKRSRSDICKQAGKARWQKAAASSQSSSLAIVPVVDQDMNQLALALPDAADNRAMMACTPEMANKLKLYSDAKTVKAKDSSRQRHILKTVTKHTTLTAMAKTTQTSRRTVQ